MDGGDNPWDFGGANQYPPLAYGDIKSALQRDYEAENAQQLEVNNLTQLNLTQSRPKYSSDDPPPKPVFIQSVTASPGQTPQPPVIIRIGNELFPTPDLRNQTSPRADRKYRPNGNLAMTPHQEPTQAQKRRLKTLDYIRGYFAEHR